MRTARRVGSGSGPGFGRARHGRVYRGSRKRLREIKWSEHSPIEFWAFVALVLVSVFIVILVIVRYASVSHQTPTLSKPVAGMSR
jgi:hypothetical protein